MESRKIGAIFMVSLGLLFGMYAMVQILTQGWNAFTEAFKYIGGALLLGGFIMPRFGFWVLLISMGYLDLVKRLLVVAGTTTYYDIAIILAFSPILAMMVFAGIVVQDIRKFQLTGERAKLFVATCLGMVVLGSSGLLFVGGGLGGMKHAAQYGAFVSLIYVVPSLFDTDQKVYAMLRRLVWIFVPVALYAFWQTRNGMSWWEIEYLETGLSGESRILFGQDFRVFSTLNSSQNLSKVMAMAGALALMVPWAKKKNFFGVFFGWGLFCMFFLAAFYSGSRTGLVMGIVAVGCYVLFRYKVLTAVFYSGTFILFIAMVMMSDHLLEEQSLNRWTGELSDSLGLYDKEDAQRVNLATFSVRLESFSNLKEPGYWTPFGFKMSGKDPMSGEYMTHDMLGRLLVAMGYIPLGVIMGVFGIALWRMHRNVWRYRQMVNLKLLGASLVISVLVGGLSAQENIGTFPVNGLLYLAAGVVLWATYATKRAAREAAREAAQEAMPAIPQGARPGFGGMEPRPSSPS